MRWNAEWSSHWKLSWQSQQVACRLGNSERWIASESTRRNGGRETPRAALPLALVCLQADLLKVELQELVSRSLSHSLSLFPSLSLSPSLSFRLFIRPGVEALRARHRSGDRASGKRASYPKMGDVRSDWI